jgi:hypothetical protein
MPPSTFAGFQRRFQILPSRYLMYLLAGFSALLLSVLYLLPFKPFVQIGMGVVVLAATGYVGLRDAGLNLAKSCLAFSLEKENEITLIQRNGQQRVGKISAGGLLMPLLVLMNINLAGGGRRSLVLLPDSMQRDALRHLRVLLKWERQL